MLTVMSAPLMAPLSPNGSTTSSVMSSEDSSSTVSGGYNPMTAAGVRPTQHYSLPPQPPSTSATNQFVSNINNHKQQIKVCRVCGDRAKSYHFGGISCDSCKAFFRRSVQNDAFLNFHCPYDRNCEITINSRKSCQFCRFKKCTAIGMEKTWVMSEEERMQMLKNRIEKRKHEDTGLGPNTPQPKHHEFRYNNDRPNRYQPYISQINTYLTIDEVKLIENIMNQIRKCSQEISFDITNNGVGGDDGGAGNDGSAADNMRAPIDVLQIFFKAIQQFALFVQTFPAFGAIPTADKQVLLRGGVLELCFLRGAFSYDMRGKHWRYDTGVIYSDSLQTLLTKDLLEKHMQFIKTVKRLRIDEPTYILLSLVILLTADREGLTAGQLVQSEQEKYLLLLKAYMAWRYGPRVSALLYPKLLLKLADLRELAEAHTDYELLLGRHELRQIQHKLSDINLATIPDEYANLLATQSSDSVTAAANAAHLLNTFGGQQSSSAVNVWTIGNSITDDSFGTNRGLYDEELSTSSEGSERLLSD